MRSLVVRSREGPLGVNIPLACNSLGGLLSAATNSQQLPAVPNILNVRVWSSVNGKTYSTLLHYCSNDLQALLAEYLYMHFSSDTAGSSKHSKQN